MSKGWVFWMGFWFSISIILFFFFGIPIIAYLGATKKTRFLPSYESLLEKFPYALEDISKRKPYVKLDYSTALSVLYVELLFSDFLIKIIRFFKYSIFGMEEIPEHEKKMKSLKKHLEKGEE